MIRRDHSLHESSEIKLEGMPIYTPRLKICPCCYHHPTSSRTLHHKVEHMRNHQSPIVPRSPILVAVHAMANAAGGAGPAGGNPPPPPLAYASGAQFNAQWDACVTDQARAALEQEAITRSPIQDVQFARLQW
jgi:hypothetical protein